MTASEAGAITQLLHRWREGDAEAFNSLFPLVYDELRHLAGHYMKAERGGHTLQATALVHDAFIRLVKMEVSWQDRAHFMAVAAQAMRRILVDHARALRSDKRGGRQVRITLSDSLEVKMDKPADLVALDEALSRLESLDKRKSQTVELVYFGGLSRKEAAEILGVSRVTVQRDLRQAKAWLYRELTA